MTSQLRPARRVVIDARGVTLVEVLIVIAILSLVAGGVAVAAYKHWVGAQQQSAKTSARVVRKAVEGSRVLEGTAGCPSVDDLISSGVLDEDSARADPWGVAWRIECAGHHVTVSSAGPDRQFGTDDDIRVPPKTST